MFPVRTILQPTDFSEPSGYAFRLACSLAREYGARLIVLHVYSPPAAEGEYALALLQPAAGYPQTFEEQLRQVYATDAKIQVEYRVEAGFAATEILRVAHECEADLIVMGTHGRTGLGRLLLGSVAEQVLRKAACPVLTVKTPVPAKQDVSESRPEEAEVVS